jgi:hypothetical protein
MIWLWLVTLLELQRKPVLPALFVHSASNSACSSPWICSIKSLESVQQSFEDILISHATTDQSKEQE